MRKIFIAKIKISLVLAFVFIGQACTNLDEKAFSVVTADNFFTNDEEFISALGAAYTSMYFMMNHNNWYSYQEVSTDEMAIPQKGADWFDGGQWIRTHRHEWLPDEQGINGMWNSFFQGINNTNRLIDQFEAIESDESAAFVSELKGLRAFFYYFLLDNFGNVPIVDKFSGETPEETAALSEPSNNADFQAGRNEVFNFVEAELTSGLVNLPTNVDNSTYARMTQWAARFLLAKLYLNAEVYTGTARWQDVITQCDAIINSGNYSLAGNFFDNFVTENSGSPEFILAIPYDEVFATGFNLPQMTLHYQSQFTFDLAQQPWNGYTALEDLYNSYDDSDVRKTGLLEGPQFNSGGEPLIDASSEAADPDGPELNFTPEINELEPGALRQAGTRVHKWRYETGSQPDLNNDFGIFRYADVIMMKAEALLRLGNTGEALTLVNQIRERAGVAPYNELTLENLEKERRREFFMEGWRRQDQIRLGSWNDAWWEKTKDTEDFRIVYPIPRDQLDANQNLVQNPGY